MPADETVNSGPTAPGAGSAAAVGAAIAAAGMAETGIEGACRNDAHLQHIRIAAPRRLPELLRLRLAEITGADQADFSIRAMRRPPSNGGDDRTVRVPFTRRAAAGGGSVADEAAGGRDLAFPPTLLRRITAAPASGLKLLSISGDSMSPTLEDGDLVMVDTQRRMPSPPGIFILDDGVGLVAKRVDAIPNSWPLALRLSSDNPAYSNYRRQVDEVHIVGRVVWFARSI